MTMISLTAFKEGLYITVLGITVVFAILSILAVILYAVGWIERRLVKRENRIEKKARIIEAPAPKKADVEKENEGIPPHELAVITAAILAYTAKKAEELRPVPIRRKASDLWRIKGGWSE